MKHVFVFREYGEFEMVGSAADCAEYVLLVAVLPPHACPVWLQSSMSLVLPPVSDSPSFPSAKLEEWRAINRSHFSPVNSPLVNGVDKPHLEPEAQYSQVKKPHVKRKTNQIKSGRSRGKSDYVN